MQGVNCDYLHALNLKKFLGYEVYNQFFFIEKYILSLLFHLNRSFVLLISHSMCFYRK